MTARVYLDEDSMDRALVAALRARGVDVLTALEADMIERDDADHLEFSTAENRVLLTCNTGDFCRLHHEWLSSGRLHAGIVCMPQHGLSIGPRLRRLLRLFSTV